MHEVVRKSLPNKPVQATIERLPKKKPLHSLTTPHKNRIKGKMQEESKAEIGTKRKSKCSSKELKKMPVRQQFIVQVYPYLVLKCNFYLLLGTACKANLEQSLAGEVYRTAWIGFIFPSYYLSCTGQKSHAFCSPCLLKGFLLLHR